MRAFIYPRPSVLAIFCPRLCSLGDTGCVLRITVVWHENRAALIRLETSTFVCFELMLVLVAVSAPDLRNGIVKRQVLTGLFHCDLSPSWVLRPFVSHVGDGITAGIDPSSLSHRHMFMLCRHTAMSNICMQINLL